MKKKMSKIKVGGTVKSVPEATKKSHIMSGASTGKDKIQTSNPKNAQTMDKKMKGTF